MKSNYKIGDVLLLEEYGVSGVVGYITPSGGLYGTWSDQEIDPEMDAVRKIGERKATLEERMLAEKISARDEAIGDIRLGIQHLLKMAISSVNPVVSDYNFRTWRITIHNNIFDEDICGRFSDEKLLDIIKSCLSDALFDKDYKKAMNEVCGFDMPYSRKQLEADKEKHKKFVVDFLHWAYANRGNLEPSKMDDKLKELLAQM